MGADSTRMIDVEGLTKSFGSRNAVEGVTFSAAAGEVVGFLGPNGAGKTTTMRVLASLTPPTAGRARIAGFDTVREGLAARRHVGYLPERVPLYDEMRVEALLRFTAAMKGISSGRAAEALARVSRETGIADVRRQFIGRLSRGYRQRVGLAQALLGDPPVLLLDEPTAGLDPAQIAEIRALIGRLRGERTILLSTHILPEVAATCGRVVILARGRVVAVDTPQALAAARAGGQRVEVIAEGEGVDALLRSLPGVLEVETAESGRYLLRADGAADVTPEIARALVEKGHRLRNLRRIDQSLEEIFLELVTDEAAERR